jgi:hypothetical protein
MSGILDELNQGLDDLRSANLPEYADRLRRLEIKIKDLETRLKPLLEIMKTK